VGRHGRVEDGELTAVGSGRKQMTVRRKLAQSLFDVKGRNIGETMDHREHDHNKSNHRQFPLSATKQLTL
jgi:hypothetical protein